MESEAAKKREEEAARIKAQVCMHEKG